MVILEGILGIVFDEGIGNDSLGWLCRSVDGARGTSGRGWNLISRPAASQRAARNMIGVWRNRWGLFS